MSDSPLISVVVPMLDEIAIVDVFYERITAVMRSLDDCRYEVIVIDDGSTDGTLERLQSLAASDPHLSILKFSRNFGHQIAITAGLDHAQGDAVVVIDADLQDPPEVIAEFVAKWREGYDVVYGVRAHREGESRAKLLTAAAFYRLLRFFTNIDIPVDVGDFRLMSARAVRQFRELREQDRFVRGLVSWIGFRQIGVEYQRDERAAGDTKYPYRKMIRFALDGLTSFSTVPLKIASWLGYLASFLALGYLASVFIQKALGITEKGWPTIMVSMLFLGGVQLICLGIIGEYIGRIFTEIKRRPMYIVESVHSSTQRPSEVHTTETNALDSTA